MPGKHAAAAGGPPRKKGKGRKAVAVVLVCLILFGAAGGGVYYYLQHRTSGQTVNVYPVSQMGYTNDWAERVQTGGTVRADKMQAVYLSNTQTVTEIFVEEGQQVQVGDKILAFDTTLSEVELEKARIEIEKKKLDIQDVQKELDEIATYKIGSSGGGFYIPPATSEPIPEPLIPVPVPCFQGGSGTRLDPYVFVWEEGRLINDATIRNLLTMALPTPSPEPTFAPEEDEGGQAPDMPLISSEPAGGAPIAPVALAARPTPVGAGQGYAVRALLAPARRGTMVLRAEGEGGEPPIESEPTEAPVTEAPVTEAPVTEPPVTEAPATDAPFVPLETPEPPVADEPWAQDTPEPEVTPVQATPDPTPTPSPSPSESPEPSESPDPDASASPTATGGPSGAEYYIVFEIRDGNSMQGDVLRAYELRLVLVRGRWSFEVVPTAYEPYIPEADEPEDFGSFYGGYSGQYFTAEEIAQMRKDAEQRLLDLDLSLRVAEQELKEKEFELSNGEVLCTTAGVVKSVITPEEALAGEQPVVMISGGGGYFVNCYMSEFDLTYMNVGDTVTVEDYRSGNTLDGTITEISQYPAGSSNDTNYYYENGNNNVSTYPFTIEVGEDADLREGYGVSVYYAPSEKVQQEMDMTTFFQMDNMFIRQENGQSYVYAMGDNGLLEKRYITTAGGDSWSTRITGGLDMDTDYVAFPYGRAVKDGAKAVKQEDISTLYNGY